MTSEDAAGRLSVLAGVELVRKSCLGLGRQVVQASHTYRPTPQSPKL